MTKKHTIFAFLVFAVALGFSIWRINQPIVLKNDEVERILIPNKNISIRDGNFVIQVQNTSSDKVIAKFVAVIEIKQNGDDAAMSSLVSKETWKANENKEIVIPASLNKVNLNVDYETSLNFKHATKDDWAEPKTCWFSPCL